MNGAPAVLLLVAGGSSLVVQNALMLHVRAMSGSVWAALWLNSIVGVALLTATVPIADGAGPFVRLAHGAAWWFVVPGLLGTLYVLSGLVGYGRFGAGATVSLLVASQLTAGLAFDAWRTGAMQASQVIGGALLIAGAMTVAWSPS